MLAFKKATSIKKQKKDIVTFSLRQNCFQFSHRKSSATLLAALYIPTTSTAMKQENLS